MILRMCHVHENVHKVTTENMSMVSSAFYVTEFEMETISADKDRELDQHQHSIRQGSG